MWITSEGDMIYCVFSSSQKIKIQSFLHPSTHHFTHTYSPRFLQNTKLISELRFKALMAGKLTKFVQFTQNLIHHNFASYTYKFNLRCILIGRFLQRLLTELLGQDVHGQNWPPFHWLGEQFTGHKRRHRSERKKYEKISDYHRHTWEQTKSLWI